MYKALGYTPNGQASLVLGLSYVDVTMLENGSVASARIDGGPVTVAGVVLMFVESPEEMMEKLKAAGMASAETVVEDDIVADDVQP